uniref:Uncharacterized protein n=1 Tax=Palpitomonas bilix TaxID=652834 RepID=A0A7S3DFX3_9EUKA|mmetsp:Transcript_35208/g.91379  ORF Transcript_35208/g.91379 Transcript_35208/m.91379 type:complete len:305 (+) Transcript_35208:1-915(+)
MHADMSPISPGQSSTSLFAGMHHSSSTGLRGSSGLPPRAKPTTESGVTVPHVPTRPRPRSKGSPKKTLVAATVEGGGGGSGARWEEANRGLEGGSESREREKSRREEERRARKEKREKRERAKQEKEGGRHGHSHKHPHVGSVHDHSEDVSGGDGGLDAFLKEQMAQQRRINAEGLHDENFSASFSALKAAHRDLAAAESDGEDEESSAIGGSRRHSSEVNPFGEEGGLSPVGGSSGGAVTGALSSSEFSPWGNEEEAGYEDLGKAYAPPLNAIASPRRDMPVGRIRPGMSSKISQASYYSEEE